MAVGEYPSINGMWPEPRVVRVLPVATWSREGRLGSGLCGEWYLPVALCEVEGGNVPGPSQSIQELIHSGHRVPTEFRDFVEATEVVTEAEGAIWLRDQDNWAGPWAA